MKGLKKEPKDAPRMLGISRGTQKWQDLGRLVVKEKFDESAR